MSSLSLFPVDSDAFRVNWVIENFNFLAVPKGKSVDSPSFCAKTLNTEWMLRLYPNCDTEDGYISCNLHRMRGNDQGSQQIEIDFTISLIGSNDLPLISIVKKRKTFKAFDPYGASYSTRVTNNGRCTKDPCAETEYCSGLFKLIRWDQVFGNKRLYFPNDTLILRCDMKTNASASIYTECTIRTGISVERISFTWPIEKISSLQLEEKVNMDFTFYFEKPKFNISLCLSGCTIDQSHVQITIYNTYDYNYRHVNRGNDVNSEFILGYRIYLQDSKERDGSKYIVEGKNFFRNNQDNRFLLPIFLNRRSLYADKDLYLTDDIFSLRCEFSVTNGRPFSLPTDTETSYPATKKLKSHSSSGGTLMSNIKCLYEERKHCDLTINVGRKTFKAHRVILCSRSPVFSAMLESEMNEKNTNQVNIVDFEPETIEMMLHFMYTDELKPDLNYSQASQLYSVGSKYQIHELIKKCAKFFISSVNVSNVWDILRLGIAFDDEALKKSAKSFISNHPGKVFESQAWEDLMGKLPLPEVLSPIE